jgi:chain length determinant protein EpsF
MSDGFNMSLQQLLIIFWVRKRLFFVYLLVTMGATLFLSLTMTKQYTATVSLVLDQPAVNPITGAEVRLQLISSYLATQTDIIKSPAVALAVVDILELKKDKTMQASFQKDKVGGDFREWIAKGLMKGLDVVPSRESSILGINFSASNPEFAARGANAFAQAFIQVSDDLKSQPAKETADWFDDRLRILQASAKEAREKLSNFQQTQGIVVPSNERISLEDARLAELSDQLVKSQLQTANLIAKKKQLSATSATPQSLSSLDDVLRDQVLQQLKVDLARSEGKFAETAIRFGKNHPQYKQAAAEITSIKAQLVERTNTVLQGFNNSILSSKQSDATLEKAVAEQKAIVLQLKKQYDEIAELTRNVANAQEAYDAVMQRSIKVRMESEIRQSNIAILDPATVPKIADKPKIMLNMVISVLLGSILGLGAALFAEMLDKRVRSAVDITNALDLPVFGVIAALPSRHKKFLGLFGGSS